MNKIPFSLYDFFGYLAAGCVWLLSLSILFGFDIQEVEKVSWLQRVLVLIGVYIAGHINAHFAHWLLEKKIIGALGYPAVSLFTIPKKPYRLFKGFRELLPSPLREQVLSRYKKMSGGDAPGNGMFLYCFHVVKEQCPQTAARLLSFMSLYGFSRNMSFALFIVGVSLVVKWYISDGGIPYLGIGFIVTSIVLFLRMLKFFRHYSIEVFATFGTMRE